MSVDWSRQLEAVHVDGRVLAVDHRDTTKRNSGSWFVTLVGANWIVDDEGQVLRSGWRIRNVAQAPGTGSIAPSPSEVGPEVMERMIALVRGMDGNDDPHPHYDEARAIVALLPEPVDADEAEVQFILHRWEENELETTEDAVREALKRGRALEKEAGR